jgi:hypothetical protein
MAFLSLVVPASAQYPGGQYPQGGQYPPGGQYPQGGQYPPGGQYPQGGQYPAGTVPGPMGIPIGIPGIHLPKRKSKESTTSKVTVQSVEGSLRRLNEKDLLLQTQPDRILRFRLIAKTEFRDKNGKPMRDSLLHPGDRLTIDSTPDDPETAVHVILVRAGSASEKEAGNVPVDQAKVVPPDSGDFGKTHSATEATGAAGSSESSGSSSSEDADRPVLQRQPSNGPSEEPAHAKDPGLDPVIGDARAAASSFTSELPDFLVQQITTRSAGSRYVENWRTIDVVTCDVSSVDGKEEYKNIRVNGRPTDRPQDSGSWSTGEFQITLEDIFSPYTAAVFKRTGEDRIAARPTWVYSMAVEQPRSHWTLVAQSGRKYTPAYKGSVWIDKETGRTLRIEQQAIGIPRDFAYDKSESALEYGFVSIEGKKYLLPVQSVNVACMTGTSNCSRNVIDFKNYRKFSADSNITF